MKNVPREWTDDEMLTLMDLRETQKRSFGQIAEIMGRSRNSCIGQYRRIIGDLKASEA